MTTNSYDGTVSVLLGNGDGTFGEQEVSAVGRGPFDLAVSDLNGDGWDDLAVANMSSLDNTVSVLLNDGGGSAPGAGSGPGRPVGDAAAQVASLLVGRRPLRATRAIVDDALAAMEW